MASRVVRAPVLESNAGERIGLTLAGGYPIELWGMRHVFGAEPDIEVLDYCTSGDETVAAIAARNPAVLVLDLQLPPGGMAVLHELARRHPSTRVVLLATRVSDDVMLEAVRLGVKGVVLKDMPTGLLVQCVRRVARGFTWIENGSCTRVVDRMARHDATVRDLSKRLTRRELQILQLVAEGLRNKDITAKLAIAEGTVKVHLHHIYGKLGLNDRLKLALRTRDERIA